MRDDKEMNVKKHLAVLVAAVLLTAGAVYAQQSQAPLKNNDIIQMAGAELPENVVIRLIQTSSTQFDLSPDALIALKKAHVSTKEIAAMQAVDAAKAIATPAPAPPDIIQRAAAPQVVKVALLANGESIAMQPSVAQIAQTSVPAPSPMSGLFGGGGGDHGASSMDMSSLEKLAMSNMNFLTIGSKALMFVPQVAVAAKVVSALSHAKQQSQVQAPTFVWGLPGPHSSLTAPTASPAFDLLFGEQGGANLDEYEPALLKLVQSSANCRVLGARHITGPPNGATLLVSVVEKRIAIKTTPLDRGHVRIEPAATLPAGEYAVVLRPRKAASEQLGATPSAADGQKFQLQFVGWDFSVPATATPLGHTSR